MVKIIQDYYYRHYNNTIINTRLFEILFFKLKETVISGSYQEDL